MRIFNNPQFGEIRTAGTAENPLFCLADVCKVLDLRVSPTKDRLDERGVTQIDTPTKNQYGAIVMQQMYFVNEKNLYRVIMRSDKPQAEPFQDWVCGEVLPSIRKTGSYSIQSLSRKELALMVIQAEEENERLALENKHQREVIAAKQPPAPPLMASVRPTQSPPRFFIFFSYPEIENYVKLSPPPLGINNFIRYFAASIKNLK